MPEERAANEQRSAELIGERYPTLERPVPRASGSIRNRLLVAFVGLSLLLAGAITTVSALVGFQDGRQRALDSLGVVSSFKEGRIDGWVTDLYADLDPLIPLQGTEEFQHVRTLTSLDAEGRSVAAYYDALNKLFALFRSYTGPLSQFEEAFLLNAKGEVVLSTDLRRIDTDQSQQPYFQGGLEGQYAAFVPDPSVPTRMTLVVAQPVLYKEGPSADLETIGVVAGRARSAALDGIIEDRTGLGQTGHTYLVDTDYVVLAASRPEKGTQVHSGAIDKVIEDHVGGVDEYKNHHGDAVFGVYSWLPDLRVGLLVEQEQDESLSAVYKTLSLSAIVALVAVAVAIGASLLITRSIAAPLSNLTEVATRIAAGDLEETAKIERRDEVGVLARAFNSMTAQLRELVSGLEERVAARTLELERHSTYLEASAEVASAASSILDMEGLIQQVVGLIRQRFSLYYVGLFLVDEIGGWAVLRAGTGEAGQAMLARGHRIRVGEGMIGWCIANAQSRIALDVGKDAVRLATEELPETRSEAALPLRARGRVIGALSVQSGLPAAFDEEIISVFQTLADQIAIALENARLFSESQAALEAAGRAYGEVSREAWIGLLQAQPDLGYRSGEQGVVKVAGAWRPEMEQALLKGTIVRSDGDDEEATLAVPIKVRGEVVGVLGTYRPADIGDWTDEELVLLETLIDQLGEALEDARLYRDTQRRAAREQLMGHIVDRIRRAVDMDTLMQTTIRESAAVLEATSAFVQLSRKAEAVRDGDEDEQEQG